MGKKPIGLEKIINQYVRLLTDKIKVERVILFGSAVKGKITRDSDVDIIVISDNFKKINFLKRLEFLSRARGRECLAVPMDILGYTSEEFEEISKESVVLGEARRKGKVIFKGGGGLGG